VVRLEKEMDRIYIGKMKLYVNLPRYRRMGYEPKDGASNVVRAGRNVVAHSEIKRKSKEVWREKRGKEARKDVNVKQSYAEVVRKPTQDQ